jgi:HEXXH motif-containing protein
VLSATCRNRRVEILLDTPDFAGESGPAFAPEEPFAPDLVAVWRALLRDAWRLLVDHHEHLAAEVSALVRVFAPLAAPTAGGLSATLDDAFGCIALTRPMDATSLGLTLAHEIQHAKLTAISDLFQLVEHDGDERFYAPWRDDPRPTFGMLHGVYAHLGVAGFWKRQLAHVTGAAAFHAETEFARWLDATREAVGILSVPGRLKPVGTIFLDGIATTLESWRSARVSAGARAAADRLRRAHRAAWMAAHGDSSE